MIMQTLRVPIRLSVYCRFHFTDKVTWAEHVAGMGERSGAYGGLVGKYEGKSSL
jgi:hypothetical protein